MKTGNANNDMASIDSQNPEVEMKAFERKKDRGIVTAKEDTLSKLENTDNKNIVDYTSGFLFHPFIVGNCKVYAAINVQFRRGLDFTGLYDVYLLHPQWGSNYFTMERNNENNEDIFWDSSDKLPFVGDDYIREIGLAIDNWEESKRENG